MLSCQLTEKSSWSWSSKITKTKWIKWYRDIKKQ